MSKCAPPELLVPTTLRLSRRQIHWLRRRAVEDAENRGVGRPDTSRTIREVLDRAMEKPVQKEESR